MPKFVRQLVISNRECELVIKTIDARTAKGKQHSPRKHQRYSYILADIPICIEHPDGGKIYALVFGRNISNQGMSFLHGGFIHSDSRCTIILKSIEDDPVGLSAKVRHCRLIPGSCHEVGIEFSQEIDIRQFLKESELSSLSSSAQG